MRKKVKSTKRALLRAALLRARGRRDKPCGARFKNEAPLRFSRGIRRAVPPPVCARRPPCARCCKKRTLKSIFFRREKPKHKGHVTRTFPTSYGTTSTFQLSVFSFFVYSFSFARERERMDPPEAPCGLAKDNEPYTPPRKAYHSFSLSQKPDRFTIPQRKAETSRA